MDSISFMHGQTLRNFARSERDRADRFERIGNGLSKIIAAQQTDFQRVETERNELRDRQVIVMGMIEAELTTQRSMAVQTNQIKEEIAFLEGLLVAFRPQRLTAAAWEGQEIH